VKNWKVQAAVIGALLLLSGAAILIWHNLGQKDSRVARFTKQADQALSSGRFLDAEIAIRKALEIEPNNPLLEIKLGQVLERQGVLDQAKSAYITAQKANLSAEPGFLAGMVSLRLSEPQDAERLFLENNQAWPDHAPTLYQLGAIMAKRGKYQDAVKYFEKIVTIDPKEAEAYNNLGFCYFSLGQTEKAREMFKKALEINPNLDSAKKSLQTLESEQSGAPEDGATAKTCKECK
jgi:Flp pilus assembly protein TadD